jgi:hypothetical protein
MVAVRIISLTPHSRAEFPVKIPLSFLPFLEPTIARMTCVTLTVNLNVDHNASIIPHFGCFVKHKVGGGTRATLFAHPLEDSRFPRGRGESYSL